MNDFRNSNLLVTGASGHLGRLVVEELLARGATRVVAGTRSPDKLADLAARGVEVRKLDFADAASLAAGFAGIERALIISTDAVGVRAEQQAAAIDAGEAAGVRHFVYTSAPAASPNPGSFVRNDHFATELRLYRGNTDWTILRNHIYAEIALMGAGPAIASGQLFDATNGEGRSYVTRTDAARAAAGALLTATGKQVLDVTGPAAVTQEEVADLFSRVSGKPVTRIGLAPAGLRAGMISAGVPEFMADVMVSFDVDAAQGYHAIVTDVVEQLSGRKPQSLESFLEANRTVLAG
ncbi:nucleoside-diphosphate sugar epimerase [Devosia geojensis]|uniref:Nucleoside-diphosphate sugar epimerase n=1 Tax=Devosia geojensis TaxID=443610 RepID=A0A0F5FUX7_9HYPH|nr:NAD(P)H-binding protein [Devosia geojensis]KKB11997.1 nucleoside-diphosphate sugar epimerase [Devosia geojensis]